MAFADFVRTVKNKASQMYSNFFYEGKDVPSTPRKGRVFAGQEPTPPQQPPEQQFQQYQQPVQQQYYGSGYQQPYQPGQPYQQPQPQYTPQPEQPQRARRAAQHASNVVQVDFGSQQPEAPVQEPAAQQPAALLSARIINARGMSDCRSAITLLRNGDAVLIVMENITNPGDMRRLVDTLSGACYSLTATITKVSRYGVYLLAPQTMAVFADQATNQMNAGPVRPQAPSFQANPAYAAQRPMTYTNPIQQSVQQPAQQPQPYGQPQDFTQRTALPEQAAQNFYQRPLMQDSAIPSFSNRPAGVGYAPDEHTAAAAQ